MTLRRLAAATAIAILLAAPRAHAADQDATAGRRLAESWCSECHAVHAADRRSPNRAAPRFADVASSEAGSEVALRSFFKSEHEKMPAIRLDRDQIDQLVSYILSLKSAQ